MSSMLQELQTLIGRKVVVDDVPCELIEVLSEGPAIVLLKLSGDKIIQHDQYGDARRRVTQTYTIPVYSEVDSGLHPVLRTLLTPEETGRLHNLAFGSVREE
ncbi:MAG: hypothetical protein P8Y64_11485 [Gammaproteobacteria bacterium]